jgi:hypothetical protein
MSRRLHAHGELLADHPVNVSRIIALHCLALKRGRLRGFVRQGAARP